MTGGYVYWEGAVRGARARWTANRLTGRGYVELTGYGGRTRTESALGGGRLLSAERVVCQAHDFDFALEG